MERTKFSAIGQNGEVTDGEYEIHHQTSRHGYSKIELRAFLSGDTDEEWFDFKLTVINDNLLKVTDMFVGKDSHRGKGIPEALILESRRLFNKQIISSSNKHPVTSSEWRRESADKVWMRLIDKNLAIYNEKEDIYELVI